MAKRKAAQAAATKASKPTGRKPRAAKAAPEQKPKADRSKIGKQNKIRGNSFQAQVRKILSKYYGGEFHSTPASGGLRWGDHNWTYGDIVPPAGLNLIVECKSTQDFRVDNLLDVPLKGKLHQLLSYWKQIQGDVARAEEGIGVKMGAMLVVKRKGSKPRAIVDFDHFDWCLDQLHTNHGIDLKDKLRYQVLCIQNTWLVLADLESLLQNVHLYYLVLASSSV